GQVGPSIVDGEWHHVAVVREYAAGANGEIRSYIDGQLVHTISMTVGGEGDWNMGVNPETLQIGDHLDRFT
ncbi:MAG: LamG domain-containing protein, partial [Akkermansiaceae bacterium]|nr:LamG domain-containing protein [Akkermansiaceae bacterium]